MKKPLTLPDYKPGLVANIDLIGFKSQLENLEKSYENNDNKAIHIFKERLAYLSYLCRDGQKIDMGNGTQSKNYNVTFTFDNIIVSTPELDDYMGFFNYIGILQAEIFLIFGCLSRGLVTKGSLFHVPSQSLCLGTIIEKTFKHEKGKNADQHYPKMIIDDEELKDEIIQYNSDLKKYNVVKTDTKDSYTDYVWYAYYLQQAASRKMNQSPEIQNLFLIDIEPKILSNNEYSKNIVLMRIANEKHIIESNSKTSKEEKEKFLEKWEWLEAEYINSFEYIESPRVMKCPTVKKDINEYKNNIKNRFWS
jgi:hypothetical protein